MSSHIPPQNKNRMSVLVQLQMPGEFTEKPKPPIRKRPVEEVVRECLEKIESGLESHKEWLTITKLYKDLESRKDDRAENIKKMIRPVLSHYGYHKSGREGDI
jgi:hypothetical protein